MKAMIFLLILYIILLFSILAFAQQKAIIVKFNEKMDKRTLFNIDNWQLVDEDYNIIDIIKIGTCKNDSAAILFVDNLPNKNKFNIKAKNLKDISGNFINPNYNNVWIYLNNFIEN